MIFKSRVLIGAAIASALISHDTAAQASKRSAKHASAATTPATVTIVVLPVDSTPGDSIRTIIQRDLENSDRVTAAFVDSATALAAAPVGRDSVDLALLTPAKATRLVRVVHHTPGLRVSILDGATGAVKRTGTFNLPFVPDDRAQIIRDSLLLDLSTKSTDLNVRLARDSVERDSLLRANAAPPPKRRLNTKERAAARLVAAQRDSVVKEIEATRVKIFTQARRDTLVRDSVLTLLLRVDSVGSFRGNREYRLAIHTISDRIELWLTGTRGISSTRIAYVQGPNLHVVDADGAMDEIIPTPGAAMSPAWHPSGKSIVYSDFNDNGTQIAQVDLVTDSVQMVAATPRGLNITPVYTKDGKEIVYGTGGDCPADLVAYVIGSTLPPLPLTNGTFENTSPSFSPDGMKLAFMSPKPALTPQIYVMNSDGTKVKLLTPFVKGKRSYRTGPDWSPTGDAVAYEQQNGDFQVWMINLKSGKMTQLTKFMENEDPSWAPDGRHMAITSTRGGTREIWVLDVTTGHFRQVTHVNGARLSAWSPLLYPSAH